VDWPGECAVVIPCFNEATSIATVVRGVLAYLPCVLVVDDGSTDGTAEVAAAAGAQVLRQASNRGKGAALALGWQQAHAQGHGWALCLDGDGQHDPAELPGLVRLLSRFDFVIGARSTLEMPPQRQVSNWLVNQAMAFIAGVDFGDVQSGLRVYRKDLADLLGVRLPRAGRYALEHESLALLAEHASEEGRRLQAAAAPVSCRYRGSESRIRPLDVLQLAFETVRSALRLQAADRRPALREVIA